MAIMVTKKAYGVVATDVHSESRFNKYSESLLMEVSMDRTTFEDAVNLAYEISNRFGSHTMVVEIQPTKTEFFRGSQITKEEDGKK